MSNISSQIIYRVPAQWENETFIDTQGIRKYVSVIPPEGTWYQIFDYKIKTPLTPGFETVQEISGWLSHNNDFQGRKWTQEEILEILYPEFLKAKQQ